MLGFSGHEIKGVADHLGGFRAWIPERSDFFKGPKAPRAPRTWSEATKIAQKFTKKIVEQKFEKHVVAWLLFSANFAPSLGNRVVEPQGP